MKEKRRLSGIYSITNIANNKRYIGLSTQLHNRWYRHRGDLRHNNHKNQHLQNAWNKYGERKFKFEILEPCNKGDLTDKEKYWIDKFNACNPDFGYNILYGADDYSNLSLGRLPKINMNEEEKPILVFNRYSLEFLGEFGCINDVASFYNIDYQPIWRILKGKQSYTSAFEIIYKEDYIKNGKQLFSEINRAAGSNGFYIVDLMTGEYKHFYHIEHGASYFGIPNSNQISLGLGKIKNKGYVWDQYYICNYHHFMSTTLYDIMNKYRRICYVADCGLEENLYSS